LVEIKAFFDEFAKYVKLDPNDENEYSKIDDGIKNPTKYKDEETSDLTGEKLNAIFGTTGISDADIKLSV
jgi:hypothetical protein